MTFMPYKIKNGQMHQLEIESFANQDIQKLVENNLENLFQITCLASNYPQVDGSKDRIDSLGINKANGPVIIAYQKNGQHSLVSQSLYYLDWLLDHKAVFEVLVRDILNRKYIVDWRNPQVYCFAKTYSRQEIRAVKQIQVDIELIKYTIFSDNILNLEILGKTEPEPDSEKFATNPVNPDFTQFLEWGTETALLRFKEIRDYILDLDENIGEVVEQERIAYLGSGKFALLEIHESDLLVYLNFEQRHLDLSDYVQVRIKDKKDMAIAKKLIQKAYEKTQ
ncbi:MAG: hypothetical protein ACQEQG_07990 [Bacillota bacterium]